MRRKLVVVSRTESDAPATLHMQGDENLRVVAVVPVEKAEYWMGGSARSDYG